MKRPHPDRRTKSNADRAARTVLGGRPVLGVDPLAPDSVEIGYQTAEATSGSKALARIASDSVPIALNAEAKNPVAMYLARLSEGSRHTQKNALTQICRWLGGSAEPDAVLTFGWHLLRYEHCNYVRTLAIESAIESPIGNGKPRKPATVNRYLAALRGVLTEAWRLGSMDTDSYMRAKDVKDTKDQSEETGRELTKTETDALMRVCREAEKNGERLGLRDLVMITLLSYGLRRFEVVTARVSAYNHKTGELNILGKGKKRRKLFLSEQSRKIIERWFAVRPSGDYFLSGEPYTTQIVYDVLKKRAAQAGITKSFAAHDFRRTFVSRQLAKTGDIVTTQRLVGHSDPKTTAKYDRRGDETLRKATEDL